MIRIPGWLITHKAVTCGGHLIIKPKLSEFILHVNVAAGFSLRFSSSDEFMAISFKLRNLKVAATKITQLR